MTQQPGAGAGVVQRAVVAADPHARRLAARHQAPRRGGDVAAGELHGAHPRDAGPAAQAAEPAQRLGEETDVEAGVMGDDGAAGEVAYEQVGDLRQRRGADEVLGDEPVDVGGAHVHARAGVHQGGPAALRGAVGAQEHQADLDNGVPRRRQPGGLQVDDRVAHVGGARGGRGSGRRCGGCGGQGGQRAQCAAGAVVEGHRRHRIGARPHQCGT